ncbi:hypothetical protein DL767_000028 [Monosporascus sp. MG133]|nr:hypothetical protein DL767_000028 [Monosporascus sp. MG133]
MSIDISGHQLDRSTIEAPSVEQERSQSQQALFSSFISLAATLTPTSTGNEDDDLLRYIRFRDIGFIGQSLIPLGNGTTFRVFVLSDYKEYHARCVLKRTIPLARQPNDADAIFQNRIKDIMLELRTLAHPPIRQHENVVKLLGLAWETDQFDTTRKWPILIMERATRGTLADLLQPATPHEMSVRLNLMLDVTMGLEVLHMCGIIHGDVKLENVLVFENPGGGTNTRCRPFVAKLGDFGGAMFDVSASSTLPSGTRPWNAPEWRDRLDTSGLQLTDIYSLGFALWRILANGTHPFLDPSAASQETWLNQADILKNDDRDMHEHLARISAFQTRTESQLADTIIDATLKKIPAHRDLKGARSVLMDKTQPPRAIEASKHPKEAAEAKYGLAELSLNRTIDVEDGGDTVDACLKWLTESAEAGCDRAQAILFRCCSALRPSSLIENAWNLSCWMLEAASRGHFQPLEDLHRLGMPEATIDEAVITLRFRYGGTGSQRYDPDILPASSPSRWPWQTSAELIQRFDNDFTGFLKDKDADHLRAGVSGASFLHLAASCGLRRLLSYLINRDIIDVNCVDTRGETALLRACRSGHYFLAMELLEAGADPSIASYIDETPLHWLLSFDKKYVREICQNLTRGLGRSSLNAVAPEFRYIHCAENAFVSGTPLMRAIARNRLDVVHALLDAGADPSFTFGEGSSAFRLAAQLHYPHILEVLLPRISRASLGNMMEIDSSALTLLMVTISGGSLNAPGTLFGRIRRHGNEWRDRAQKTLKIILGFCSEEENTQWPKAVALTNAALRAEEDVIEFLLEHGCREVINETQPASLPPWPDGQHITLKAQLHTPLTACITSRNLSVFRLLIKNGADTRAPVPGTVPLTLLYDCALQSHDGVECARTLLRSGVDVDGGPTGYETPFACALRNRCFNLAEFLWENGADINVEYQEGNELASPWPCTILGQLIREYNVGALACLRFLLRPRTGRPAADFIVSRSLGITVLHILAMAPYPKQSDYDIGLLLGCILDHFKPTMEQLSAPCSADAGGHSALHIAIWRSNSVVVHGLLGAGADPSVRDEAGLTLLDIAKHVIQVFPHTFEFSGSRASEHELGKAKKRARDILETVKSASVAGLGADELAGEEN